VLAGESLAAVGYKCFGFPDLVYAGRRLPVVESFS
jgi:hypothetical protein